MTVKHSLVIAAASFIVTIAGAGLAYYFLFWSPLKSNKELFPELYLLPNGKLGVSEEIKEKYGITKEQLDVLTAQRPLFLIDAREPEEYAAFHFAGAAHIRAPDIGGRQELARALGLGEEEFAGAAVVIYCHDGTRSAQACNALGLPNVKFLIDDEMTASRGAGRKEVFDAAIKERDFTITPKEALDLLESGSASFIDTRLYRKYVFAFARDFRIGNLSSKEYQQQLPEIIALRGRDIVFICDIYPDLFYAKLLIQRLSREAGFPLDKFFILFAESRALHFRLGERANKGT